MSMMSIIGSTKSRIQFIAGFSGSTLASGVTTVNFTGLSPGDFLLVMGGSQQIADPTFTAGWTKITSYTSTIPRVGIFVYKWATATTDTITFTGTGTSSLAYSAGYAFKNVRGVGNSAVITGQGTTLASSIPSPALTLSDTTTGGSALIVASYVASMSAAPTGLTLANGMAYGLLKSSWSATNFTSSSTYLNCGIVELLN